MRLPRHHGANERWGKVIEIVTLGELQRRGGVSDCRWVMAPRATPPTERGWVQRRANTGNSRSWLVQLTPAGWAR
jgi:hypothetical protein